MNWLRGKVRDQRNLLQRKTVVYSQEMQRASWRFKDIKPLPASAQAANSPANIQPALLVGFGRTGYAVLSDLLQQLLSEPVGGLASLRVVCITDRNEENLPNKLIVSKIFPILGQEPLQSFFSGSSRRAEIKKKFHSYFEYKEINNYLNTCIRELRGLSQQNIQVYLVASLAEASGALVGEAASLIRQIQKEYSGTNLVLRLVLTTTAPEDVSPLDPGEMFAAMREISRMSFVSQHYFDAAGGEGVLLENAIIDQIFLIEPPQQISTSKMGGFHEHSLPTISELIYLLIQPHGAQILQNMRNLLVETGKAKAQNREMIVDSASVATLTVPQRAFYDYVNARLARAVLFGENPANITEGVFQSEDGFSLARPDDIGKGWLLMNHHTEPLFQWLLNASNPSDWKSLPPISAEMIYVFQAQIAEGVENYLNDQQQRNALQNCSGALQWLREKIQLWQTLFKIANENIPSDGSRLSFQAVLNNWQLTIENYIKQITDWEKALLSDRETKETQTTATPTKTLLNADWRSAGVRQTANDNRAKATTGKPLEERSKFRIKECENRLHNTAGGVVRRSPQGKNLSIVAEAKNFYTGTVRPELSHSGDRSPGQILSSMRDRIGWWFKTFPGQEPVLYFVCLPGSYQVESEQYVRSEIIFLPENMPELLDALIRLAEQVTSGMADELTGKWFEGQVKSSADFLARASRPSLQSEPNLPTSRWNDVHAHYYILARSPDLRENLKEIAFHGQSASTVQSIQTGNFPRVTALAYWVNIPVETLSSIKNLRLKYNSRGDLHIHNQEKNATLYERRIRSSIGVDSLLPAQLTATLVDQQIVTLFCQCFLTGIINTQTDEQSGAYTWTVEAVGRFPKLTLANTGQQGLWNAYVQFVFSPYRNDYLINPNHQFHPGSKEEYVKNLFSLARDRRSSKEFYKTADDMLAKASAELILPLRPDPLYEAFFNLLIVEREDPVWKGW